LGYKAFISYKHVRTTAFAEDLEYHLKRFAKGPFERPDKLFRDEQYLKPGDDLPQEIEAALKASGYLILLASPEAAISKWVESELSIWCVELGRAGKLIIVQTAGVITVDASDKKIDWQQTDALPVILKDHLPSLPLFVDLSWVANKADRRLDNNAYRTAVNAIAARIRGLTPNELSGREWKIRRRNLFLAWSFSFVLLALLGIVIAGLFVVKDRNTQLSTALRVSRSRELTAISQVQEIPASLDTAAEAAELDHNRGSQLRLLTVVSDNPTLYQHIRKLPAAVNTLFFDERTGITYTPVKNRMIRWAWNGNILPEKMLPGENMITNVIVSSQGRIIVSIDNTLWDMGSGKMVTWFQTSISTIQSDPNYDEVLVGLSDGDVLRAYLNGGKSTFLYNQGGLIAAIAIGEGRIVSAALNSARAVDLYQHGSVTVLPDAPTAANAIQVSPDNTKIAVSFEDGSLGLYTFPGLRKLWVQKLVAKPGDVKFDRTSERVAAGGLGGEIAVFNVKGYLEDSWKAGNAGINKVAWYQDTLITAGADGWVRSWVPGRIWPWPPAGRKCSYIYWDDEKLIGIDSNTVWDLGSDKRMASIDNRLDDKVMATHGNDIVLHAGNSILLYNIQSGARMPFGAIPANSKAVSAEISGDGTLIAVCWWPVPPAIPGPEGKICLWEPLTGKTVWIDSVPNYPKQMAMYDKMWLAVAGENEMIILNLDSHQLISRIGANEIGRVSSLSCQEGFRLVVGKENGIEIVDAHEPRHVLASTDIPKDILSGVTSLPNKDILCIDNDGISWFDSLLNFNGSLINSKGDRQLVMQIEPSPQYDQLSVRFQSGEVVSIPLKIEAWIESARKKGHVLIRAIP
jgi:WD40 repeat protein